MRIVCPRCVAQYEVDESAIPEAGREVQCANCENIWFQDYIEMLPTAADEDSEIHAEDDRGVFDDLDGKSDADFYSNRGDGPSAGVAGDFEDEDDAADLMADDLDDDDFDDDDDTPATNIPIPPVDEEVLDVLRSEAAFSSARDQLDAAAADALDGNGEALKSAQEDAAPAADDLTAFLDAHAEEALPEEDPVADVEEDEAEEPPADPTFDPLADLNAIRSQLDTIGAEEPEPEYIPNLPTDDPIEDLGEADEDLPTDTFDAELAEVIEDEPDHDTDAQEDEPEYDDPEFDSASLTAALDMGGQDRPELDDMLDDDFDAEDDGPRHAYRADGITPGEPEQDDDEDNDPEPGLSEADQDLINALNDNFDPASSEDALDDADDDDSPDLAAAAAAVAITRPRSKGGRARARAMPGMEPAPEKPAEPVEADDDLSAVISDAADSVADIDEETLEAAVDTSRRPKRERKARLPDVEELDASLRSEADEPRRRDREMMDAHEDDLAKSGKGGFRRAFIWTLFIIALLIALYIMRPQLVAALPAAAMVLDPYAAAIDTLRGLINGLLG